MPCEHDSTPADNNGTAPGPDNLNWYVYPYYPVPYCPYCQPRCPYCGRPYGEIAPFWTDGGYWRITC